MESFHIMLQDNDTAELSIHEWIAQIAIEVDH